MEDSLHELRECLITTKLINWELSPLMNAIHVKFVDLVFEIISLKGQKVRINNDCSCIYMEKEKIPEIEEISPSNDVILKELSTKDSKLIDAEWPYSYDGSELFIESLIKLNGGLGIYCRKNDELLSWVLQVECYGIG